MRKTDLFPENDSPGCELREPERPIDAPYAVDIPAVPTALGALDAASRAEFWAALALSHTDGLGARSRKRLLDAFGSAFEAVRRANDWREAGLREDLIREFRSEKWREPARKEWDATRKLTGTVLLWTDSRYPALLKELPDAPIRLYCQGDMSLLGNPCVSIVGTRTCSREGIRAAQAIASGLAASGITVVSGLAIGIDKQAHLAALDLPGGTIAVLGAGSDVCYPKENDGLRRSIIQRGLLISEYAPGTLPDPRHFPIRNRIISGLSLGVVVVEAALRSGSLITARLALEQNRAVYAVPGGIGSKYAEGCQKLIRDGAQPIFSFSDILSDLSAQLKTLLPQPDSAPRPYSLDVPQEPFQSAPAAPPPLRQPDRSTLEGRILTLLAQSPRAIDDVCQSLGCDPGEAGSTLIILEVRGLIRQRPDLVAGYVECNGNLGGMASADAVDGTLANSSLGSWTEEEVQAMIDNEVSVWMFNGETDGDNPAAQQDVIEIVKDLYREAGKSESWIEEHVRASGLQSWKFKDWGETDHSVTKVVAWYYLGQPYMDVEKGTSLKAGDTYQYSGKEESYEKYQYTMDYVYTVYPESVAQWAKDVFASV